MDITGTRTATQTVYHFDITDACPLFDGENLPIKPTTGAVTVQDGTLSAVAFHGPRWSRGRTWDDCDNAVFTFTTDGLRTPRGDDYPLSDLALDTADALYATIAAALTAAFPIAGPFTGGEVGQAISYMTFHGQPLAWDRLAAAVFLACVARN